MRHILLTARNGSFRDRLEDIQPHKLRSLDDVIEVTQRLAALDPVFAESQIRSQGLDPGALARLRSLGVPASYVAALEKADVEHAALGHIVLSPALARESIVDTLVASWNQPPGTPTTGVAAPDGSRWRTVGWIESDPVVISTQGRSDGAIGHVPWEHGEPTVVRLAPDFETFVIAAARLYLRELAPDPDLEPPLSLEDLGISAREARAWMDLVSG